MDREAYLEAVQDAIEALHIITASKYTHEHIKTTLSHLERELEVVNCRYELDFQIAARGINGDA